MSELLVETPRGRRIALAVCMFLITASFGFLQPFVPLYLAAAGLDAGQIGVVVGLGTGLALLVQPLLGRLSDRLDARRPLMVATALISGLSYAAYAVAPQGSLFVFLLLTFLGVNGTQYLNAVGGVLVGRMMRSAAGGGAMYAGYRVWGSVGYIVVALASGLLISQELKAHAGAGVGAALDRHGLAPVFLYGPWLFLGIALSSLAVPDRKNLAPAGRPHAAGAPRLPLSRNVRWFLLALFLYQFALYGASAYLSLYLKSLGATPLWITGIFAAGVVCEVLVMTRVGRFADRYGRRPPLAVAFLIMPLRLLAYIPAHDPVSVLLVQMLHGLNFGIMGAIAVVFINDLAAEHNRGAAQARLAGVMGLAVALGPVVCGGIVQQLGMGWMFAAMSAVGAAGAVVFLTQVHESHPTPEPLPAWGHASLRPFLRLLSAPSAGERDSLVR